MDLGVIYAIASGLAGVATGYIGGKGARQAQADAISALASRVDVQQQIIETIPGLKEEIRVLTGLVTQKAPVEELIKIVERIEDKIDAQARQS
jgi:hypothetical protein